MLLGKQKGKTGMVSIKEGINNTDVRILKTPLSKDETLNLRVGDMVLINGIIVTGRDKIHKFLLNKMLDKRNIPFKLDGGIIYHCGPIIKRLGIEDRDGTEITGSDLDYSSLKVIAAGPTTSMRLEVYEADFIKRFNIRGIIGKGGMGDKTLRALKRHCCVYFQTIGGASAYLAERIRNVLGVWRLEEFGMAEAMWGFDVVDFPAVVTMDAHGNSLHKEIEKLSFERLKELLKGA